MHSLITTLEGILETYQSVVTANNKSAQRYMITAMITVLGQMIAMSSINEENLKKGIETAANSLFQHLHPTEKEI